MITALVIGFLPLVGLQSLQRGQLDGLNVWYEARILHTRVPVGGLVDWVDQAFLCTHLERVRNRRAGRAGGEEPAA